MNLAVHITICCVLIVAIVGLMLYKKWLEDYCDHNIHLHNDSHDSTIITAQAAECRRIELIDKTKNYLIAAVCIYALAIIAVATYSAWNAA
jgi:hypothetical protein